MGVGFRERGIRYLVGLVDEKVFLGIWFVYTFGLVYVATGYRTDVRMFPILVGVFVLLLSVVRIGFLVFGGEGTEPESWVNSFSEEVEQSTPQEAQSEEAQLYNVLSMFFFLFVLVGATWALGILLTIPLFVFTFIYIYERNVRFAVVTTALVFSFIYVLFIVVLSSRTIEGRMISAGDLIEVVTSLW